MVHNDELVPAQVSALVPHADRLRLAVAAYLARFKGIPATRDSAQEMERALMTLFGRERRAETYRRLADSADVQLSPRGTWLMYRIADNAPITRAGLAHLLGIANSELEQRLAELVNAGYVTVDGPAPATGEAVLISSVTRGQMLTHRKICGHVENIIAKQD